jgi:hypothetical protein
VPIRGDRRVFNYCVLNFVRARAIEFFRNRKEVIKMTKAILRAALIIAVAATTAFGASQKMTCTKTGKKIDKCCCEDKNGKFYCTLTKKAYDKCCCEGM